jgi:hypothetical protein
MILILQLQLLHQRLLNIKIKGNSGINSKHFKRFMVFILEA